MKRTLLWVSLVVAFGVAQGVAQAAPLTLEVVDSVAHAYAFGLAFDGTNIWYTDGYQVTGRIDQNAPGMALIGPTFVGPAWSALAFDGTDLVFANGNQLYLRGTAGEDHGTKTIARSASLIDGFDIEGGKFWWSPDVSYVAKLDYATGADEGIVLSASGGYSGVERVISGANDWLFVINDAFDPRKICRVNTNGAVEPIPADDCATLPNSRYEDLAFDGRYLYAADYYGGRIDKIDLKLDGGSIFEPPTGVPEPGSLSMLCLGLAGIFASRKRA